MSPLVLHLLAVGGDDEAAKGFVVFCTAVGERSMPFLEPFFMLNRITKIGVCFSGRLFYELECVALCFRYRLRIPMLGAMGDDFFAETVSEIETMTVRRQHTCIVFELFV